MSEELNARSDLFSLGLAIYEMLSGVTVFHDSNLVLTIEKVLNRYGLKIQDKCLFVSNSNKQISRILKDTPWADKWRPVLKMYSETSNFDKTLR